MLTAGTFLANKLRIVRLLGAGGMGTVYEAIHVNLGCRVAVKLLHPDASQSRDVRRRFIREARALALVPSDHIVQVLDADILPSGDLYMVMEFLDGRDLKRELQKRGCLPPEEAVMYVLQACEGIAASHRAGIVHRDLKPGNLFLTYLSGSRRVKLLDFGAAKMCEPWSGSLTGSSTIGTPIYMAPEQLGASSQVDERCDIWSLGVVLYELITGQSPFCRGSPRETYKAVLLDTPPPLVQSGRGVAPELEAVVMRCLAKEPELRYASATELAAALRPFAKESGVVDDLLRVPRGSSLPPPLDNEILTADELERRAELAQTGAGAAVPDRAGPLAGGRSMEPPETRAPDREAVTVDFGVARRSSVHVGPATRGVAPAAMQRAFPTARGGRWSRRWLAGAALLAAVLAPGGVAVWIRSSRSPGSPTGSGVPPAARDPSTQAPQMSGVPSPAVSNRGRAAPSTGMSSAAVASPPVSASSSSSQRVRWRAPDASISTQPRPPKEHPAGQTMPGDSVPLTL